MNHDVSSPLLRTQDMLTIFRLTRTGLRKAIAAGVIPEPRRFTEKGRRNYWLRKEIDALIFGQTDKQ